MTTITTELHTYRFNIEDDTQRAEYEALCERLEQDRKCSRGHASSRSPSSALQAGLVELEIKHLFADQWTSTTHQLYDWYEAIYPNECVKDGYYLTITPEMRDLRRTTRKCGYCGAMYFKGEGDVFCDKCLGNRHLKQEELSLLRLLPIKLRNPKYPKLTEAEQEFLLPLYVAHQTTANVLKLQRQREKIEADRKKQIDKANTHADGLLWLLDHGVSIENVIYYEYRDAFCFGWRTAVDEDVASALIEKLTDFPFPYEIKRC